MWSISKSFKVLDKSSAFSQTCQNQRDLFYQAKR